jgi:hypothetical protein
MAREAGVLVSSDPAGVVTRHPLGGLRELTLWVPEDLLGRNSLAPTWRPFDPSEALQVAQRGTKVMFVAVPVDLVGRGRFWEYRRDEAVL